MPGSCTERERESRKHGVQIMICLHDIACMPGFRFELRVQGVGGVSWVASKHC